MCAEDDIDGTDCGLIQFTKEENLPLQRARLQSTTLEPFKHFKNCCEGVVKNPWEGRLGLLVR